MPVIDGIQWDDFSINPVYAKGKTSSKNQVYLLPSTYLYLMLVVTYYLTYTYIVLVLIFFVDNAIIVHAYIVKDSIMIYFSMYLPYNRT